MKSTYIPSLRVECQKTQSISLKDFYVHRAFRILPPMYITLALAWVALTVMRAAHPGNALGFVSAIGYFFNYMDLISNTATALPAGMGVLWSLMIEEHFYFLFPILYLTLLRHHASVRRQVLLLAAFCCAALVWRFYLVYIVHTPIVMLPRWTYSASDARFDSILWGCILAIACNPRLDRAPLFVARYKGLLAAAGVAGLIATLLIREPHFRETLRYTVQAIALLPIFYYCVASPGSRFVSWLEWKPLRWVGWLSYSMYLSHEVIISALMNHGVTKWWLLALIAFPAAVLYASAIRFFVELPAQRVRSALGKPPALQPAVVKERTESTELEGQLHA